VEQLKEDLKDKSDESEKLIHYNYINIVLDEIELYYHPEWQRTYIADLLDYIGKINPENLKHIRGLNITFLTHSPYILSDIPDTFVLKLLKGSPELHKEEEKTFGSNIHDLLANDFFMKNGFMGEFARTQIDKLINEIKPLEKISKQEYEQNFKKRIEIIGEPFIQTKLLELVASKSDNNLIDSIIEQRSNEIDRLRMLKNRNSHD
jgi:predicted ATP-binding protein involved in virulence